MKIVIYKIIDPNQKRFVKHYNCFTGTCFNREIGYKWRSLNFSLFGIWILSFCHNKQKI